MNIWLSEIWRAWRASLRRPGFLLLASGVLALGIGASVAVFTLIDQVLLKPLPLPQVSQVVVVGPLADSGVSAVSPQQYQHLRPLKGVAALGLVRAGQKVNISGGGAPQVVAATYIDHGMLAALGLQPVIGRGFTTDETALNGPHVAMLSYGLWQRRYGGDRHVVGQTLRVKGDAYTIVGILPKAFDDLAFSGQVILPLALQPHSRNDGTNFMAVARLKPGASMQAVGAQVDAHLRAMYADMTGYDFSSYWMRRHFGATSISAWQHADAHAKLMLFMACALFVLLTALVNLVNLALLRSLSRVHDGAVRSALGAPPSRLALPALAEGLLVGVSGSLVGTALAALGLSLLEGSVSAEWLPQGGLHVGAGIWWLALAVGIVGALLASSLGIWRSRRVATIDELREGGRSGLDRKNSWLGRVLVVAQMTLATVLLCATGLLLHGLYQAERAPLGFATQHILAFDLAPVRTDYPNAAAVDALSRRLVRRLEAIPGVTQAAVTTNLPADGWRGQFNLSFHVPGGKPNSVQFRAIGPGYFHLFEIPLLRGRRFATSDVRGAEPVALISQSLAKHLFDGHALGKTLERGQGSDVMQVRIVGVVGDTHQFGPLMPAPPILYVPLAQVPDHALAIFRSFEPMRFALRGHGHAGDWRAGVKTALAEVAPTQPIDNFRSMSDIVRATTSDTRRTLLLVGIFAALALLLAVAGMYAVMAVAVAAREREFGVRMALGAKPSRLMRLVLRGGLIQIVVGLAVGVVIVLSTSSLVKQLLIELLGRNNSFDGVALVSVCVVLGVAGLLACLLPALRAGRVQPMQALRGE